MSDKCPFCGAAKLEDDLFECFSRIYKGDFYRGRDCYETQIARLQAELDEINLKDRGKTNELNILTKENNNLQAAVDEAKIAFKKVLFIYEEPAIQEWLDKYGDKID